MLITKKFILLVIINCSLLITNYCKAQDSSHIRISLLTCTPGEELYSTFGHTALRVIDSSSVSDIVYNYGTFDFDDEGFYLKFIRGKLPYYVSTENFKDFKYLYQITNRGITEQVLNLTAAEKIALERALLENIKEENKYYKYDFFFDNCTTRVRDLILKYNHINQPLKAVMPAGTRFRQAIHEYLDNNGKHWSKLGIDIMLGAPTDAIMTSEQSQFLPNNLMKALDNSNEHNQFVLTTNELYPIDENTNKYVLFTPMFVFSALLIFILLISRSKNKGFQKILSGFDGLLFFITGSLGILLVFMWTSTDHAMCKENFNLLWAFPVHAIAAFFITTKKSWVKIYLAFTVAVLSALLLLWFFLPQQMNNALIPIVLLLIYRAVARCFIPDHTFTSKKLTIKAPVSNTL